MTTRREIESEYTVTNGVIRSPGKFEGEPAYVAYFWEEYLTNGADEDLDEVFAFVVDAEDVIEFPELAHRLGNSIYFTEDSQGFVSEVEDYDPANYAIEE